MVDRTRNIAEVTLVLFVFFVLGAAFGRNAFTSIVGLCGSAVLLPFVEYFRARYAAD